MESHAKNPRRWSRVHPMTARVQQAAQGYSRSSTECRIRVEKTLRSSVRVHRWRICKNRGERRCLAITPSSHRSAARAGAPAAPESVLPSPHRRRATTAAALLWMVWETICHHLLAESTTLPPSRPAEDAPKRSPKDPNPHKNRVNPRPNPSRDVSNGDLQTEAKQREMKSPAL